MSRYEKANETVIGSVEEIKKEYFPELVNCYITTIMDTKKKKVNGELAFARIKKANDIEKYLSFDEKTFDSTDFFLFIDKNIYEEVPESYREKIIRHELRHVLYDSSKKDPYSIIDHDVKDFKAELQLNKDDPDWKEQATEIANMIYEN